MSNGFRNKPSLSKNQIAQALATEVKNLSVAVRITQMMQQQIVTNLQRLDQDINRAMSVLNDLQYRTLGMLEAGNISKDKVDEVADAIKLKDYNEASAKEDAAKNYTTGDVVEAESIVIVSSEAADNKGFFRSKFKLSDSGLIDLQQKLEGCKVGDKVEVTIAGVAHTIELHGIRNEPAKAEETASAEEPVDVKVTATPEVVAAAPAVH